MRITTAMICAEVERATKSSQDRRDDTPRFREHTVIYAFFAGVFLGAVFTYGMLQI